MRKINNKGFTLIELIVCFGILVIVTTSIALTMNKVFENQKKKEYEEYINIHQEAACTYADINDLREECPDTTSECILNVEKNLLISAGLLEENIKNPYDNKIASDIIEIKWTEDGEKICKYEEGEK